MPCAAAAFSIDTPLYVKGVVARQGVADRMDLFPIGHASELAIAVVSGLLLLRARRREAGALTERRPAEPRLR